VIKELNVSGTEIEVKFTVSDKATFAALKKVTRLGDFQLKPVGTKSIVDRYLDTPHKHILKAGYACRVRRVKHKQILTLKSLSPPEGSIHRRQEIEEEVDTDWPEGWPPGKAKDLVQTIAGQDSIRLLFIIYQTRHVYHVLSRGMPIIELSLDEVSLDDVSKVDFMELEVELLPDGNEADLARLVATLQDNWPLQLETKSKFERALARLIL